MLNRRLLALVRCARAQVLVAVAIGLAITATYLGQGLVVAHALARIFAGRPFSDITGLLLVALVLIGLRGGLIWAREQAATEIAATVKLTLRARLYEHLLALGPGYLLRTRTGMVLTTLVNGVESLDRYAAVFVPQLLVSLVGTLACVAIIATVDPVVGVVVLACGASVVFAPRVMRRMLSESSRTYWRRWRTLGAEYLDAVQGMSTLKALGATRAHGKMLRERSWGFYRASLRLTAISNMSVGAIGLAESGGLALAIGVGALRFEAGALSITELLVLLLLSREAFRPLKACRPPFIPRTRRRPRRRHLRPARGRARDHRSDGLVASIARPDRRYRSASGLVRPRELRVRRQCPPSGGRLLARRGAARDRGDRGAVGAGKTTVLSLLLRFFDPDSGLICVDGVDAREIGLARLRSLVSVVSQDVYLFHGTVFDNVAFGRPGATPDEVRRALRLANASDFVEALPAGAESVIGDRGLTLSGGQRQRLAIARALVKDAPILVLDKATSTSTSKGRASCRRRSSASARVARRSSSPTACRA